jgi:hypothetical protein
MNPAFVDMERFATNIKCKFAHNLSLKNWKHSMNRHNMYLQLNVFNRNECSTKPPGSTLKTYVKPMWPYVPVW